MKTKENQEIFEKVVNEGKSSSGFIDSKDRAKISQSKIIISMKVEGGGHYLRAVIDGARTVFKLNPRTVYVPC